VVFNSRLRSSVGRADFRARTIELNPRLLDRHPGELLPTLAHELCHLVAGARAGHGSRWRAAMSALGQRAEACHRLDVTGLAARRRTWIWRCSGCGEVYHRRHRRAQRFLCGRCGRRLGLEGPAGGPPGPE
jgi:predicted SprT family Zn-dependent metalloprotease